MCHVSTTTRLFVINTDEWTGYHSNKTMCHVSIATRQFMCYNTSINIYYGPLVTLYCNNKYWWTCCHSNKIMHHASLATKQFLCYYWCLAILCYLCTAPWVKLMLISDLVAIATKQYGYQSSIYENTFQEPGQDLQFSIYHVFHVLDDNLNKNWTKYSLLRCITIFIMFMCTG